MITINNKDVADIVIDNKNVIRVQDATTLEIMWEKTSPTPPANEYFYLENTYNGSNTVTVKQTSSGSPGSSTYIRHLQYSKDKNTWVTVNLPGTYLISLAAGEKVYFRGNEGVFNYYSSGSQYAITNISASKNHTVGGNINTLLDYTDPNGLTLPQGAFNSMFKDNIHLTSASNIILSHSISTHCYRNMFNGCSGLTTAPAALPATTLAQSCYYQMFRECTALTTAPALPATTLASYCYNGMFWECTSLTTAPALPATTLAESCYRSMFSGCTALNKVYVYADDNSASNCTYNWLASVASSGTFTNYGSATYTANSSSGIPSGWTEVHS